MSKRRLYVISGVTGMTGSELAKQIIEQGHQVIGFDNLFASSVDAIETVLGDPHFSFYQYDLCDEAQMSHIETIVSQSKSTCEIVYVNCAAVVHTEHFYEVNNTFTTNVLGMKAFLDQAIRVGATVYINCSTSEVYSMESWNEDGGLSEDDFLTLATAEHSQRTSYATGKLLTEFFIKDAVDKGLIRGCSIRFANVYSDNELYPKHIIPHILTSLQKDGSVTLLENSKVNQRTFLHNIDSCSSILELINSPKALDGTVYNVATDQEISIVELVKLIGAKMGLQEPKIKFEEYRKSDPERRVLNTSKIKERTRWEARITLDKGLDMCIKNISKR